MEPEHRKKIDEIMGEMDCPKKYKCVESGFEDLCKARNSGLDSYLDCLNDHPPECSFALPFGMGYLCQCPLRVYLVKNLGK